MIQFNTEPPVEQCAGCNELRPTYYLIMYQDYLLPYCRSCADLYKDTYPRPVHPLYAAKHEKKVTRQNKRKLSAELRKQLGAASSSAISDTDWIRCLKYFKNSCAVCGTQDRTIAKDHWLPMALGHTLSAWNCIPLCNGKGGCNQSKGDKDPYEWLHATQPEKAAKIIANIRAYFEYVDAEITNQQTSQLKLFSDGGDQ